MKKYILILACFTGFYSIAQQSPSGLQQFDSRANRYYSINDLAQMDALKIGQLNFFFQQSWVVNTMKPCPEYSVIEIYTFNVDQYALVRQNHVNAFI